jgi:hypothetical protein
MAISVTSYHQDGAGKMTFQMSDSSVRYFDPMNGVVTSGGGH